MSLIGKLTDTEKLMIGEYIDSYASDESQRVASVEHILRLWDKNKSVYLDRLLDGQLMITKKVTYKQDTDETAEEVRCAILKNKDASKFLSDWRNMFGWFDYPGRDLPDDVRFNLYDMPNFENLATNVWSRATFEVPFPDGKTFKVQRGSKITKAMGKIAKAYNMSENEFEAFRIACSQGLNQKTITGDLTLSIHPLDYMTMSDNECDWSSCMSWRERGCYRQGTVEMMNSPMVVVAYLTADSANNMHIGGHEWNSKKWRELMIVTPDIICNVLGYPYRNAFLSEITVDWLKELAEKNLHYSYGNDKAVLWKQCDRFYPFGEENSQWVRIETETYRMYNDFGDREHFGYFNEDMEGHFNLYYSGPGECMICGQEDPDMEEESCLAGYCCEEAEYCDICGERISSREDDYWVDDLHLCSYCYDERTREDIFENIHLEENVQGITLMSKQNKAKYDTVYVYYTDWNWTTLKRYFKRIYGVKANNYSWDNTEKYYVHVDDLTPEGIELFCCRIGCFNAEELEDHFDYKWYRTTDTIDLEDAKVYAPDELPLVW